MVPDPDLNPDPSPFFSDFKDAKKLFHIISYIPTGTLSAVLKILFFAKILC
jgi:hypothetical protein